VRRFSLRVFGVPEVVELKVEYGAVGKYVSILRETGYDEINNTNLSQDAA